MKQDKQLLELLSAHSEKASDNFTEMVMQKVNAHAVAPYEYVPLVSPRWQKVFLIAFAVLALSIFALISFMAVSNSALVSQFPNIDLTIIFENKMLSFLVIFWIVFCMNALLQKKFSFKFHR